MDNVFFLFQEKERIQYFLPIYIFFHLTFRCYCFCSSNVPTLYSLLKLVNKSINIWPFFFFYRIFANEYIKRINENKTLQKCSFLMKVKNYIINAK